MNLEAPITASTCYEGPTCSLARFFQPQFRDKSRGGASFQGDWGRRYLFSQHVRWPNSFNHSFGIDPAVAHLFKKIGVDAIYLASNNVADRNVGGPKLSTITVLLVKLPSLVGGSERRGPIFRV